MRTMPTTTATPPAAIPARPVTAGEGSLRWPGQELLGDPILAQVLFSVWSGDVATVVPSPPGSGKTRLVALLAAALAHKAGMRVAIAAQTRAQAAELGARIAAVSDRCALLAKKDATVRGAGRCRVVSGSSARWSRRNGGEVLIATTARWLYVDAARLRADVLLVDEAYQCTYSDLGALGALAPQLVCVGDPGQIAPVVTGDVSRWANDPMGPHRPAPTALCAAYGTKVAVRRLRHSWRLGPDSCELVSGLFYPDLPFTSRRPPKTITLDGTALPEISHTTVRAVDGPTDPVMLGAVADRARALLGATLRTDDGTRPVSAEDVAIVVPHVAQAATLRALLADERGLLIDTANALQGIERSAVVALHPLTGYRSLSAFAADPGRLCVALSRHSAHMSVVLDHNAGDLASESEPDLRVIDALSETPRYRI